MEAVFVLLVGKSCAHQPAIEALHGFGFCPFFVAWRILFTTFAAAVPAAARISDVLADGVAAAHAVATLDHAVFEAHAFTP